MKALQKVDDTITKHQKAAEALKSPPLPDTSSSLGHQSSIGGTMQNITGGEGGGSGTPSLYWPSPQFGLGSGGRKMSDINSSLGRGGNKNKIGNNLEISSAFNLSSHENDTTLHTNDDDLIMTASEIPQRRTGSHSPKVIHILNRIYQEVNEDSCTVNLQQKECKIVSESTFIRNKSCNSLSLEVIRSYDNFRKYLMTEKQQSDLELLEINDNLITPEQIRLQQAGATYWSITLGNLKDIIIRFVNLNENQVIQQSPFKDEILKFEKLRTDMLHKIKSQAGAQAETGTCSGQISHLSKNKILLITSIYGSMRFILTRFGRIINLFDTLHAFYKKKRLASTAFQISKPAPAIRKIQQLESIFSNDSNRSPKSFGSGDSFSAGNRSSIVSLLDVSSPISSQSSGSAVYKAADKVFALIGNRKHIRQTKNLFEELNERDKIQCIEKYLKALSLKWREDYEEDRKNNVPLIVCRICSQKFYADKEKEHSQYCLSKINKIKELPQINQKFLEISNLLTEQMIHIEKINQCKTPRLMPVSGGLKPSSILLNTPTLKRRAPLNMMMPESTNLLQGKLASTNAGIEKIPELARSDSSCDEKEGKKEEVKEMKPAKKPSLFEPLPMIPEAKPTSIPEKTALSAQQKLFQMVPKIGLNKLEQLGATQQPQTSQNPQNPLLLYSARALPTSKDQDNNQPGGNQGQAKDISAFPEFEAPIQPQLSSQKNVSFTLNTLRGLEAGPIPKKHSTELLVQLVKAEPTKSIEPILPTVLEKQEVLPTKEEPSKEENKLSASSVGLSMIQPLAAKTTGSTTKTTQIRSILKMSEPGMLGVAKPQTPASSGFMMMQPISRKEENDTLLKSVKSQPEIKETTEVSFAQDKNQKVLDSSEKKIEDIKIELKLAQEEKPLIKEKVSIQEEEVTLKQEDIKPVVEKSSALVMPQPLKKNMSFGQPAKTSLSGLASSLRAFEKPAMKQIDLFAKKDQAPAVAEKPKDEIQKGVQQNDFEGKEELKQETIEVSKKVPPILKLNLELPQPMAEVKQSIVEIQVAEVESKLLPDQTPKEVEIFKQEIKPQPPISTRSTYSNALGFFKAQKNEEKKIIEQQPNFVVEVHSDSIEQTAKREEAPKISDIIPKQHLQVPQANISQIQLPKSPYLQNVKRKYDVVAIPYSIPTVVPAPTANSRNPQADQNLNLPEKKLFQTHQPQTSPYISMNATKEQRQQHILSLKKHVQAIMQKGTALEELKKSSNKSKMAPISNAFSLEIKNQREEALKNMEQLRQSVKLKKRANPLEKIMSKLMTSETSVTATNSEEGNSPHKKDIASPTDKAPLPEIVKTRQNYTIQIGQLTSIAEACEDEGTVAEKIKQPDGTPSFKQEEEIKLLKEPSSSRLSASQTQKVPPSGKTQSTSLMIGMSPIISFRPLNKFGAAQANGKSVNDMLLQVPSLERGRESHSSQSSMTNLDEDRSQAVLLTLQNAKAELEILENLKQLSLDIFNISSQVKQGRQRKLILERYLAQLEIMCHQDEISLGTRSREIMRQFIDIIKEKLKAIDDLENIEKGYRKTIPWQRDEDFQLEDNSKLSRKMSMSIQAKEAPSQMVSGTSSKGMGSGSSGGHYSLLFSPMPDISRPLFPMQKGTPRQMAESSKFMISQTPMLQSRSFQDLQPLHGVFRGGKEQPSQFQSSLMKLQELANQSKTKTPVAGHIYDTFGARIEATKPSQVVGPSYSSFHHSNSFGTNHYDSSKNVCKNYTKPLGFALNSGEHVRQKSQFSNQNAIKSSVNDRSSVSKSSTFSPEERKSSSSSFYSDEDEDNYESQQTPQDASDSLKSPVKRKSHFLQQKLDSEKQVIKPDAATAEVEDIDDIEPELPLDVKNRRQIHQYLKSDSDLGSFKGFKKPPRIPGRSSSRNSAVKAYNSLKSLTFDGKFFDSKSKSPIADVTPKETDDIQALADTKLECQSDIIIGQHLSDDSFLDDDERNTHSDIHEMFFVDELFKDDAKFYKMILKSSHHTSGTESEQDILNSSLVSDKEFPSNDKKNQNQKNGEEVESDQDEDEVLTIDRVRFSSMCILPSQMEHCQIDYQEKKPSSQQVSINDFILLKSLSSGAYGKVILARKKNTDDFFAIKVLDKQKMMEKNVVEYVINEKNILSQVSNEFIV